MTRSRRSMAGGKSSRPLLLLLRAAGLATRLDLLEQFLILLFVRPLLRRDDHLLLRAGRFRRLVAEVQMLLIGRLAATFAAAAPQHVDHATTGRL